MDSRMDAAMDTAALGQIDAGAPMQAQLKAHMDTAMRRAETMARFSQGTMEAMMSAGQIWTAGLQALSKHVAANAQVQMDHTVTTIKSLATMRSVQDMMELQATYAKVTLDRAMADSNHLSEASMKLAEQAMAPLSARVSVAMETFSKAE